MLASLLEFRRVDPKQPDAGSPDTAGPLALAIHDQRITVRYACRAGDIGMGSGEYGRGDIHTNTIEGYFSIFKRGMKGVYQHCAKHHLHRYLAEFDFRYNQRVALGVDDGQRADKLLRGIVGRRLTYQTVN